MDDERVEQLERRIQVLEGLVRNLLSEAPPAVPMIAAPPPSLRESVSSGPKDEGDFAWLTRPIDIKGATEQFVGSDSTEQWIGLRGVLAVGVGLVLLAAVFGLKWAIDHGYISPLVRCVAGGIFGGALAAFGWRQHHRGLARYGAALVGLGCAIVYLVLWAAGQLYGLIPPLTALDLLGVLSMVVAFIAIRLKEEGLGFVAAIGALASPLLLPGAAPSAQYGLLYLATVSATLGQLASVQRWRGMASLVIVGFGFGVLIYSTAASTTLIVACATAFGLFAMATGTARKWRDIRLAGFLGAWYLLFLAAGHPGDNHPLVTIGGLLLSAPLWWTALSTSGVWPDDRDREGTDRWSPLETLYFYLTPLFLTTAVGWWDHAWFAAHPGAAVMIVGAPYLLLGYQRIRKHFAVVGVLAMIAATMQRFHGTDAIWVLLGIALCTTLLDRPLERRDGRFLGLVALAVALLQFSTAFAMRAANAPAFVDSWAVALWATTAFAAVLAARLWRVYPEEHEAASSLRAAADLNSPVGLRQSAGALARDVPSALWVTAGALLFAGVSVEFARLMAQLGFSAETAALAAGLAVSAWWAFFAGGLVVLGFRRNLAPVRVAGLLVAAMAVGKVLLFDLAQLDALYRIASFLILGFVLLGVAYLYHRQARNLRRLTPP